jgi:hypothetical protein
VVKSVRRNFLKAAGFLGLSVFVAGFADPSMEKFKWKMEHPNSLGCNTDQLDTAHLRVAARLGT